MADPCPDPSAWVAWLEGDLKSTEAARLKTHAAACPACLAELAALAETFPSVQRLRRWPPWTRAAAAALLATAAGTAWLARARTTPPSDPLLPSSPSPASDSLVLGRSASASFSEGASFRVEGASLHLASGRAWVDTPGEPVQIVVGPVRVLLDDAEVEAGWRQPAPFDAASFPFMMGEAAAAEGEGEGVLYVCVLRGEAMVEAAGGRTRLTAGQEARWKAAGLVVGVCSSGSGRKTFAWIELQGGTARDGSLAFAAQPHGDYRLEFLVRKRSPLAESAVGFAAAGRPWEVFLGSALPEGEGWIRVAVEARGPSCRVVAGPQVLVDGPLSELVRKAYPGPPSPALAVRAWGGDVEVRQARWRALP